MIIKFNNHAYFSIELDKNLILFDPWFKQRVLNGSWSLPLETKLKSLLMEKLTHISHEHKDQICFPNLKSSIQAKPNINLIFTNRYDLTAKNVLKKIGTTITVPFRDKHLVSILKNNLLHKVSQQKFNKCLKEVVKKLKSNKK